MLWGHAAQVCVARRWGASVAWGLKRLPPPRHAVEQMLRRTLGCEQALCWALRGSQRNPESGVEFRKRDWH